MKAGTAALLIAPLAAVLVIYGGFRYLVGEPLPISYLDGHFILRAEDYGQPSLDNYDRVIHAAIARDWPNEGLTPEYEQYLSYSGRLYCSMKRSRLILTYRQRDKLVGEVMARLSRDYKAETAHFVRNEDEVAIMNTLITDADTALCPTGYPNPVTRTPDISTGL